MAAKKVVRSTRTRKSTRRAPVKRKATAPKKRSRSLSTRAGKRPKRRPAARKAARHPKLVTTRRKAAKPTPAPKKRARPAPQPARARTAQAKPKAVRPPAAKARPARPPRPAARPALDRQRRQLPDDERGSLAETDSRLMSSVRTGSDELQHLLAKHTEASPALTAGDVDANWGDAYAVGDEAPGGDNPTPDQDRVDDIGKALGVNYEAGEELQGSEKIIERDRHRWELDPASSDDWPHEKE